MPDDNSKNNRGKDPDRAVTLEYGSSRELPRVTSIGVGEVARRIIALAQEHEIPVEKNTDLTRILSSLKPGQSINPESFRLVAEVISFLYHTDKKWALEHDFLDPLLAEVELEQQDLPGADSSSPLQLPENTQKK